MGIWDGKNIGDRDISEGDTNEVNLYRNTIEEIRPASQVGYIRGWDIKGWGFKRGMTVLDALAIFMPSSQCYHNSYRESTSLQNLVCKFLTRNEDILPSEIC